MIMKIIKEFMFNRYQPLHPYTIRILTATINSYQPLLKKKRTPDCCSNQRFDPLSRNQAEMMFTENLKKAMQSNYIISVSDLQ